MKNKYDKIIVQLNKKKIYKLDFVLYYYKKEIIYRYYVKFKYVLISKNIENRKKQIKKQNRMYKIGYILEFVADSIYKKYLNIK